MDEGINLREFSEVLSLSLSATDVYITLLVHGELKQSELAMLVGRSSDDLSLAVNELLSKDMIVVTENYQDEVTYTVITVFQLENRLEKQKDLVKVLKSFVLPKFSGIKKFEFVRYQGIEGIRKVYWEILEEAHRTGEDIMAFESGDEIMFLGPDFIEEYVKKRLELGVNALVVGPSNFYDKEYRDQYQGQLTEIKLLENFEMDANINIVGDLVMTFSLDPAQGVLSRSRAEATTLKSVFMKIWKMA